MINGATLFSFYIGLHKVRDFKLNPPMLIQGIGCDVCMSSVRPLSVTVLLEKDGRL